MSDQRHDVVRSVVAQYNDKPDEVTLYTVNSHDGEWITAQEGSFFDLSRGLPLLKEGE